jgi:predicted GNAT superfamily acetyltransferase
MMIRNLTPADLALVHAWNQANTPHVNSLDFAAFSKVYGMSSHRYLIEYNGSPAGFSWLMHPESLYESVNFRYFKDRFTNFLYLDRIVIGKEFRGKQLATTLYEHIFTTHPAIPICCEVNSYPPNIASMKLHTKLGFKVIGEQSTDKGKKNVQLMVYNHT